MKKVLRADDELVVCGTDIDCLGRIMLELIRLVDELN
jgi:hypothetical protein